MVALSFRPPTPDLDEPLPPGRANLRVVPATVEGGVMIMITASNQPVVLVKRRKEGTLGPGIRIGNR